MSKDWIDYGIKGTVRYGEPIKAVPYARILQRREEAALLTLQSFFNQVGKDSYVAVSFGVDSLVAYDLAHRSQSDTLAVWVNQGPLAEWPDCIALKELMVRDGMNLVEITPDITLYDWYQQHGIPFAANMNNPEDERLNKSLLYDPLARYQNSHNKRGVIWGLRWRGEGGHRCFVLKGKGAIYTRKVDGITFCSPVAHWTKTEIWAYIDHHRLPYPAFYDIDRNSIRNGPPIGVTGVGQGRVVKLRQMFPELWRIFCLEFDEIQKYG
jgi:3'-phosphoadenosine 5'-phosphosulfate sulfotransferase (PAPS reductase)/FAD synthetase